MEDRNQQTPRFCAEKNHAVLQSERLNELLTEQIGADKVEYKLFHNYKHAADQLYSDENLGILKEYLDTKLAK